MPALRFKTCRLLPGNVRNRELSLIQRRILRRLRNKRRSIKRNLSQRENLNSNIKSQTTRKLSLYYGDLPIREMHRGRERTSYIPFLLNQETRSDQTGAGSSTSGNGRGQRELMYLLILILLLLATLWFQSFFFILYDFDLILEALSSLGSYLYIIFSVILSRLTAGKIKKESSPTENIPHANKNTQRPPLKQCRVKKGGTEGTVRDR